MKRILILLFIGLMATGAMAQKDIVNPATGNRSNSWDNLKARDVFYLPTHTMPGLVLGKDSTGALCSEPDSGRLYVRKRASGWKAIAFKYEVELKQNILVSGTNIKTINSTTLLGSGDLAVQATLVSGTNIKTINSTTLLGSGDLAVQATLVSGTNIKTINSTTLLGSGDLTVQATLVSGTNIKTINGSSLLGSGDITAGATAGRLLNASGATLSYDTSKFRTYTYSGTASRPAVIYNGTPFAGTGTTSTPLVLLQEAATSAATTWATGGTYLGINARSGFTGKLVDFMFNNNSYFSIDASGNAVFAGSKLVVSVSNNRLELYAASILGQNSETQLTSSDWQVTTTLSVGGTKAGSSKFSVPVAPTASANYALMSLGNAAWNGSTGGFFVGSANGTVLGMNITGNADFIRCQVSGANAFKVDNNGAVTAASAVIVTSGNVTATRGVFSQDCNSDWFSFKNSEGNIDATSDGVFCLYNNAFTSFTRLQFGGTTTAFPSLQRNGTKFIAKLADGSADAHIGGKDTVYNASLFDGRKEYVTMNCFRDVIESYNGAHKNLSITYVAALATPTSGTDNTAMNVKTIALPANTLARLGDRLRIVVIFSGTDGSPIQGTVNLNGVTLTSGYGAAGTDRTRLEAYVSFIDNTHANIENMVTSVSTTGVAGFTWNLSQNIILSQDAVSSQHIDVYSITIDVLPITN